MLFCEASVQQHMHVARLLQMRCPLQVMTKTALLRKSSQGKLSKDKIKAAFAKNKRLPTPYEERLYQVRATIHCGIWPEYRADLAPTFHH